MNPEHGETSEEKVPTGTLKVKSSKGRTVEVVQVGTSKQAGGKIEARDESDKKDESTQQEEYYETESDSPPIEFEDPMYKLMQEEEIEKEYEEMAPEQEEELVSQLTPRERAEYREIKEFYHIQADEMGQGMELRSAMIKERAK